MSEIHDWTVTCNESDRQIWKKSVQLSEQDLRTLLKMLLCQCLEPQEIIDSLEGRRPSLLEIRSGPNSLHTLDGLRYYTARKVERP